MSSIFRRPASVTAAAVLAWAFAGVLATVAVIAAVVFESRMQLGSSVGQPRALYALAGVTILCSAAALLALGALAAWLRKTDLLLVFTLWLVTVGAAVLAWTGSASGMTAAAPLFVLVAVITATPVVLLLHPTARDWLPPIPMHPFTLVLIFGPVIGVALVVTRRASSIRFPRSDWDKDRPEMWYAAHEPPVEAADTA